MSQGEFEWGTCRLFGAGIIVHTVLEWCTALSFTLGHCAHLRNVATLTGLTLSALATAFTCFCSIAAKPVWHFVLIFFPGWPTKFWLFIRTTQTGYGEILLNWVNTENDRWVYLCGLLVGRRKREPRLKRWTPHLINSNEFADIGTSTRKHAISVREKKCSAVQIPFPLFF